MRGAIMDVGVNWLAGFSNGDFSMTVSVRPSQNSTLGWRASPKIVWSQNELPYVAGFIDADGAIKISIGQSKAYSLGHHITPDVCIDSSDTNVILKIKNVLEANNINVPQYHGFSNRGIPMQRLEIIKVEDIRKTLELVLPYLVGRKRIQAELMLKRVLPIFEEKRHLTKEGFIEIMELRDFMVLSKKKDIRKYNTDYFKTLWDIGF